MTDELARLICGDCREVMLAFEAEAAQTRMPLT